MDDQRKGCLGVEMLKVSAKEHIELGEHIEETRTVFYFTESAQTHSPGHKDAKLDKDEIKDLHNGLIRMFDMCQALDMRISADLISDRVSTANYPQTSGEYNVLIDALKAELKSKLFLHVPKDQAEYYESDKLVSADLLAKFPNAAADIKEAGSCYATGRYTACVYHLMRALEFGLKALATAVGVMPGKLDQAQWGEIITTIGNAIQSMAKGKRGDPQVQFWAESAASFFAFKEAWRNATMHVRSTYDEPHAKAIMDAVIRFTERLTVGGLSE